MFNLFGNNKNIYIYPLSHSYLNLNGANPLTLKFIPGPRDNGCQLMEIHVFWYNGCNCGFTRCINHMYTCEIRRGRAFVSMQHLGQSMCTSKSLQGQSFINSNKKLYQPSHIAHFWIGTIYRNICVAVLQNHVK